MSILLLVSMIMNIIGWALIIIATINSQFNHKKPSAIPGALLIIAMILFIASLILSVIHATTNYTIIPIPRVG